MGDNVIRTKIRLDEADHALAKQEARRLGISMAEFVRRAIHRSLRRPASAPWMLNAGFVKSGDPRSSRRIDEVVYGLEE